MWTSGSQKGFKGARQSHKPGEVRPRQPPRQQAWPETTASNSQEGVLHQPSPTVWSHPSKGQLRYCKLRPPS